MEFAPRRKGGALADALEGERLPHCRGGEAGRVVARACGGALAFRLLWATTGTTAAGAR